MPKVILTVTLLVLCVALGCDQFNPSQKKAPLLSKPRVARYPLHRFAMTRGSADVAFDTQTGQICRTWAWQPTGQSAKLDPVTGNQPQRTLGEFAPTCLALYQQYPSG